MASRETRGVALTWVKPCSRLDRGRRPVPPPAAPSAPGSGVAATDAAPARATGAQAQSAAEEDAANSREIAQVEAWLKSPRWQFTERPYDARDIVELRGSVTPEYVSNYTAKKLWALLRQRFAEGAYSHTFGALDTIQAVQMAAHLETVYVSGWQCSSTASTTNEPGPDFADYPSDTVPCKVDQLFRAQLYHDRKQREARSRMSRVEREAKPPVDYLR